MLPQESWHHETFYFRRGSARELGTGRADPSPVLTYPGRSVHLSVIRAPQWKKYGKTSQAGQGEEKPPPTLLTNGVPLVFMEPGV